MDWNALLRPTRSKFLLAALIYLAFVPFIHYCVVYDSLPGMFPKGFSGCKYLSLLETFFNLQNFNYPDWLFAFAGIPISYFAACLLVLPFQKQARNK